MILTHIPPDVNSLQVSFENRLGASEFSDPFDIKCGFKGCKAPIAEIVGGIIGTFVFVCLSAGFKSLINELNEVISLINNFLTRGN